MSHDKRQLAVYTIIFSIWWVFCLGTLGFSKAIIVRAGHLLGANEPKKAKRSAILVIIFGQLLLVLINILLFTLSGPLGHLFTTDDSFGEELAWNIRIFSFLINTDVKLILEGVMNACCKQGIQMALRFLFQLLLGNLIAMLLVYFVSWKALAILVSFSVANICCVSFSAIILSCSKWENISLYIGNNITLTLNADDQSDKAVPAVKCCKLSPKTYELVRYIYIIKTQLLCVCVCVCLCVCLSGLY